MTAHKPLPDAVTMTDAAVERIKELMNNAPSERAGLRLGIDKGGCAGMSYTMAMVEEAAPGDDMVEKDGARIYIDPSAVLFLLGTEMDYKVDKLSAQFIFNNPNQVSACGCGESVSLQPAKI